MLTPRFFIRTLLAAIVSTGTNAAGTANYPDKPVRIVTSEPGGGADFGARIIAQGLTGALAQQVIVDNRPSGVIPGKIVAAAPADGYTLLFYGSTLWILPLLQKDAPYHVLQDFSPITLAVSSPNVLVVHPSVQAKSVQELIALAKAKPGQLNYSSGPPGSSNHLTAELFKSMAHVDIVRVGYKGSGPALNDVIGGHVQMTFVTAASAAPLLKSGKLRALAVTSLKPSALTPGLPTMAAAGLPGYEFTQTLGVVAPAGMPAALVGKLNREIVGVLNRPDVKERFFNAGVEVVGSSAAEFAANIRAEIASLGKVIKEAGIHAD